MNKLLLDLEKLELNELTYIFEYLVELINQRKALKNQNRNV